jgi:hypothetical protein
VGYDISPLKRVKLKILTASRQASSSNFKFNSREWRNIVTHMGNLRGICFSHYLTRITDLTTCRERHKTFESSRFSGVKTP